MTAAAFISRPAAMVAPDRIAQIQIAGIRGRTDYRAANRTGGGTQSGIARRSADRCTAGGTQQGTTGRAVTWIGAATRNGQGRHKTQHHCRAHVWLPFIIVQWQFCEVETR